VDRTVLPGIPAEEAADGVVGAEDLANKAGSLHRVSKDSGKGAIRLKAPARTAIMAGRADPTGRNSASNAPGQ
jgi:hypothetical protein